MKFTLNLVTRLIKESSYTSTLPHTFTARREVKQNTFIAIFKPNYLKEKRPRPDFYLIVLTPEQDMLVDWKKNTTSVLRLNFNIRYRTNRQIILLEPQTSLSLSSNKLSRKILALSPYDDPTSESI
jgi:hypothetical protein